MLLAILAAVLLVRYPMLFVSAAEPPAELTAASEQEADMPEAPETQKIQEPEEAETEVPKTEEEGSESETEASGAETEVPGKEQAPPQPGAETDEKAAGQEAEEPSSEAGPAGTEKETPGAETAAEPKEQEPAPEAAAEPNKQEAAPEPLPERDTVKEELQAAEETTVTEEGAVPPAEEEPVLPAEEEKEVKLRAAAPRLSSGAEHTLAVDAPSVTIVQNTGFADDKYSFSLKAAADTKIEYWQDGDGEAASRRITDFNHENKMEIYDAYGVSPGTDALSGRCGVWIRNAGVYQGKKVHVKCTFSFESCTQDGMTVYPVIVVSARKDGMIGLDFLDAGAEVTFDLFTKDGTGNDVPLQCDMSLNFGDIDCCQCYGFRNNSGSIHSIQAAPDCKVYYRSEVSAYPGYLWMYSGDLDLQTEPDTRGEIRMELERTSSFSVIYGGWLRLAYREVPDMRLEIGESKHAPDFTRVYDRYLAGVSQINEGIYVPAREEVGRAFITYFSAYAYVPYRLQKPVKTVSDSDENEVESDTLLEEEEPFTYHITQFVPLERPSYRYKSFAVTDVLHEDLEVISHGVTEESGRDVSDMFTYEWSEKDHMLRFECKDPSAERFYNATYDFAVTVRIREDKRSGLERAYKNRAERTVRGYDDTEQKDPSNEVVTNVPQTHYEDPRIIIRKSINDDCPSFGTPVFLYSVTGSNGLHYTACIRFSSGQRNGETSFKVAGGGKDDVTYTIREIPDARYEQVLTEPVTANTTVSGKEARMVFRGKSRVEETGEVRFSNRLRYYGKFSHNAFAENRIE